MPVTKLWNDGRDWEITPDQPAQPKYGSKVVCSIPPLTSDGGGAPIDLVGTVVSETYLHNVPGRTGPVKLFGIETEVVTDDGVEKIRVENVPTKWVRVMDTNEQLAQSSTKLTAETVGKISSLVPGMWQKRSEQALRVTHQEKGVWTTSTIAEANPIRAYSINVKNRLGGVDDTFTSEE